VDYDEKKDEKKKKGKIKHKTNKNNKNKTQDSSKKLVRSPREKDSTQTKNEVSVKPQFKK